MKDLKLTLRYLTPNSGWAEVSTWARLGENFQPKVPEGWELQWARIDEYRDDEMRGTHTFGEY